MNNYMLTTVDNPYNPFNQWPEWFQYDTAHGHHTSAFLARVVVSSDELSEADQDLAVRTAIDEIVNEDVEGIFTKIDVNGNKNVDIK